jgi:uncharacterized damage-inducible protein DinB
MFALTLAAPIKAQSPAANGADPIAESIRSLYRPIRRYLLGAAEKMPEADYAFRPTPDVRTFGQIIGHVANTHYNFCSWAKGEPRPAQQNHEQTTEKAALIAALTASLEYCDAVYDGMTDSMLSESVKIGQNDFPRSNPLIFNLTHSNEHYGNLVTYMRMKGRVPPSSGG